MQRDHTRDSPSPLEIGFKNVLGTRLEGTFECKARLENADKVWSRSLERQCFVQAGLKKFVFPHIATPASLLSRTSNIPLLAEHGPIVRDNCRFAMQCRYAAFG